MDPLLRQWKMLQLIPRSPGRIGTAELKTKLEGLAPDYSVDLRTIQRDLNRLSEMFPITSDGKRPSSWYWLKEAAAFDLPGMDLTAALTFRMVELFLAPLLPRPCLIALDPQIRRARRLIGEADGKTMGRWPEKVTVVPRTQPLLAPTMVAQVVEAIYEGVLKEKRICALYRRKGEEDLREYEISPLGLVVSEPIVYLVCTLWDYSDVVLLALHRFQSAELLERPANRQPDFNLETFVREGALGFAVDPGKRIVLQAIFTEAAAEHLQETPLCTSQRMTAAEEGWVFIEADVVDTNQLRWWLLGFGDQVEVLSPPELRDEFARIAKNLNTKYQSIPVRAG